MGAPRTLARMPDVSDSATDRRSVARRIVVKIHTIQA